MTKPVNAKDSPSPTDTPSKKQVDKGGKSKVHKTDRTYHGDEPHGGDIARKHETEEQPVHPVKE